MHHDQHHTPRPDRQEKVYIRAHASGGVISVNQRKRHIRILDASLPRRPGSSSDDRPVIKSTFENRPLTDASLLGQRQCYTHELQTSTAPEGCPHYGFQFRAQHAMSDAFQEINHCELLRRAHHPIAALRAAERGTHKGSHSKPLPSFA